MNWIKKLYYTIFYKKDASKVLGALTNCDAYKSYTLTGENRSRKIKEVADNVISSVDNKIRGAISNGEYSIWYTFTSNKMDKETMKYIVEHYTSQGYKAKIKRYSSEYGSEDRIIYVSWKHWGK